MKQVFHTDICLLTCCLKDCHSPHLKFVNMCASVFLFFSDAKHLDLNVFANMTSVYYLRKIIELTIRHKDKITLRQPRSVPSKLNLDFIYSPSIYTIPNP